MGHKNLVYFSCSIIQLTTNTFSLIKHTETLLEDKEEKLCVKVLRTLREMMAIDPEYGEKVNFYFLFL